MILCSLTSYCISTVLTILSFPGEGLCFQFVYTVCYLYQRHDPHFTQLPFKYKLLVSTLGFCLSCYNAVAWRPQASLPVFKLGLKFPPAETCSQKFTHYSPQESKQKSNAESWLVCSLRLHFCLEEGINRSEGIFEVALSMSASTAVHYSFFF